MDIFGISLGYLWDIFGISLRYLWDIFEISLLEPTSGVSPVIFVQHIVSITIHTNKACKAPAENSYTTSQLIVLPILLEELRGHFLFLLLVV